MSELLWTYGVVPDAPPAVPGIEGRPVQIVRRGALAALVSQVPAARFGGEELQRRLEDLDTLGALARAHDRVLEAALEHGDVVPFPMCTLFAAPEAVEATLDAQAGVLSEALERVRGMAEWGVKGFALERPQPPAEAPASGTEYLARRRAERERREAGDAELESVAADAHAELAAQAAAAVLGRPQDRRLSGRDAEMLLNGSYLVARSGARAFADAVEALAARCEPRGLALELTGPWPPYHFVTRP